ncbi:ATP F0F1 synthase subunit B [Aureimonas altamirensis]|jgi:F-type H+-transporting ATPase subunit b|uniref:ATP synthase subunit b n=1 Tax=Aureimonas altamirensis DSM 21988 TaxID=1121026 RepID=A0ABY1IJV3_9HYPH|nr:ATP F0F1 synthase subunit B [Aureimonas altamirensis]SHJ27574.1 F-type H+-transporting ATPase subunit b [Aureimonas altamirensis DSM 21988]
MAFDATFFALVALILFFVLLWYLNTHRTIAKSLDDRAARIQAEIDEARELKEEAKQQLAEYQRRRREAEAEAKDIVAAAKREADAIVAEARTKTEDYVTRRTAAAEQKISQAEADAIAEVRASAVNIAVAAAERIIRDKDLGSDTRLTESSIEEVRRRLN